MIRVSRHLAIKLLYILIDVPCVVLSIFAAARIRESTVPFPVTVHNLFFDPVNPFRFIFLSWIVVTILLNNAYGLYQTKREIFETVEVWQVIKTMACATLIMIVAIYVVRIEGFPRSILFLSAVFMAASLSLWRVGKRFFVEYLVSQGYNNFNVLIIGAGKIGDALADEIDKRPQLGLNIIGYLDDFKEGYSDKKGRKVLGKIVDFPQVVRTEFINKVFITCHHDSQVFLRLLEEARELNVAVRVIPQGFELLSGEFSRYNIGFFPILEYGDASPMRKQYGKRIFDFMFGLIAAVALLPVFLIVVIMIKADSRGPAFYVSRRYGRSGRFFKMYKFRSMHADADRMIDQFRDKNEADGPIFKIRKDPRITRVGRILRKYSLDELPQIWNVVKGDMSLVGPRPLPIDQIRKEDLRQLKRLEVRPGITGLWQIRGRSDISFARLVKWDMWYINNWSFWLDLNILFQTVPVVLKGRGAY